MKLNKTYLYHHKYDGVWCVIVKDGVAYKVHEADVATALKPLMTKANALDYENACKGK